MDSNFLVTMSAVGIGAGLTAGLTVVFINLIRDRIAAGEAELKRLRFEKDLERNLRESSALHADALERLDRKLVEMREAHRHLGGIARDVLSLKDALNNNQARGAMGEVQLARLVKDCLPPNVYRFQAQIADGLRSDCLITLDGRQADGGLSGFLVDRSESVDDDPSRATGALIPIDAKFPLSDWRGFAEAESGADADSAGRRKLRGLFGTRVRGHVDRVARYYRPDLGVELAIMFLPPEGLFSEVHASLTEVVEHAWSRRVLIAGPTTLMALLNSITVLLRDRELSRSADELRRGALAIDKEARRLLESREKVSLAYGRLGKAIDENDKSLGRLAGIAGKLHRYGGLKRP